MINHQILVLNHVQKEGRKDKKEAWLDRLS